MTLIQPPCQPRPAIAGKGLSRRRFVAAGGAVAASLFAAPAVLGQGKPKIVIVGGGAGGASVARFLAAQAGGALDITLIEAEPRYTSCFFSNHYLGGLYDFDLLQHDYDAFAEAGITRVQAWAAGVDTGSRQVMLQDGTAVPYDRLILSPGIDFVEGSVAGWSLDDAGVMPHAYKGAEQIQLLHAQLRAMPEGGVFAMVMPPNSYRCPPGPYERASMAAHLMTRINPTAKILILDPKDNYSKQTLFEDGWLKYYDGMIERIDPDFGGADVTVFPDRMEVGFDGDIIQVDACNVIPAQKAGQIAAAAGLTDGSGWAPVDPTQMRALGDDKIFILGDSALQGDMPKSAYSANSQARVVSGAILTELLDISPEKAQFINTCWSLIAPDDSVKVGGIYAPKNGRLEQVEGFISQPDEDAATRRATFDESASWYSNLTLEIFG